MKIKRITQPMCALALALSIGLSTGAKAQDKKESSTFKSADEIIKQIVVEGRISFEQKSLPFKFDSTELASKTAKRQLKEIVKALQSPELKGSKFLIEGHTCDLGSDTYNLDLSKRRAGAILNALTNGGVERSRLKKKGLGESRPAVENSSDANRAKNRRVEIKKLKA